MIGDHNRIESDGDYNYQYDHEGNRISRTSIANGSYQLYEWNYRNQLTAVTNYTAGHHKTGRVEYEYDALNRRIRRRVDETGDGTFEIQQRFLYDTNVYNDGFIDLGHFFESADWSCDKDVRGVFGENTADAVFAGGVYVEFQQSGKQSFHDTLRPYAEFMRWAGVQEQLGGKFAEYNDWLARPLRGNGSSAWTPEDIPSDWHGAVFGARLNSVDLLSAQLRDYFLTQLRPIPPKHFPHMLLLPASEGEWERWFQTKDPMHNKAFDAVKFRHSPSIKRTLEFLYYGPSKSPSNPYQPLNFGSS